MARFRGHFYNWYDTRDLRVLEPPYVSSVDSGNLAGHLIVVARACEDWKSDALSDPDMRRGLSDTIGLAEMALAATAVPDTALAGLLAGLNADCRGTAGWDVTGMTARAAEAVRRTEASSDPASESAIWTRAVEKRLLGCADDKAGTNADRLDRIAAMARDFAMAMEFGFLLVPEKKLLSIGFSVATNMLDASCYDLLASECRLGSLFAIAKGDVETRHWFRLGRPATPLGAGSALISWSGSMFEYLMPSLVMRAPAGSVLEQTTRLIVARQRDYGAALGIPWGISESSYNARDLEMTYQYSNFGVPGLGLKRGLSENRVIAPYATGLATMVDPQAAVRNYADLAALGAEGRYGFYEAVDFTAERLPAGTDHVIVRSFMAHHQGMTITAIANALQVGRLRDRFDAEPIIQGVELLLQERVPRDADAAHPHAEEVRIAPKEGAGPSAARRFADPGGSAPTAHLLSNGRYGIMLTPTGAGYSRWRDLAVTRWRADQTQDALGSFIYMRDVADGMIWSAGFAPLGKARAQHRALFNEHHACFTHEGRRLSARTDVVVSAQDDAEGRRVSLTNTGRQAREIDLTSYAELVLAPAASDLAHPAFSKMFVVTDYMPELGVIIATRRKRSPQDPEVWAAHIAVVEGEETAPIQIETDRAKFIGRGRDIRDSVMAGTALSGTTGTVLDPVFSIRRRVSVPAGGRARVTFWTLVADAPDALLELVDRHRYPAAFDRAETLAWTQAQVQLRHLGITHADARDFQRLAGLVMRGDPRLRSSPGRIAAGAGPQSGLWPMGISGDLPIVLMLVDDADDMAQVHEVLAAHEYWRMRQFAVDLVILNERSSSYVQDLQIAVEAAVRSAQLRPRSDGHEGPSEGSVRALRADLVTPEARALLMSVAAAVLVAGRGSVGAQLDAVPASEPDAADPDQAAVAAPPVVPADTARSAPLPELEFFNGIGGFAEDGREYVTILKDGQTTPAPWINVIANRAFGFQVSAEGSGHVWSENSRENQLTPWSNDPVADPAGEAIYLRDLESDQVWTPTALPVRGPGTYVARHGFGYSRFGHAANGIDADMVQFVPMDDPVKVTRLTLTNTTSRIRRLSVTAYAEWVLGTSRTATASHVTTRIDPVTGAIFAVNPWTTAFPGRVAFADTGPETTSRTASRAEFLGPFGAISRPAALNAPGLRGQSGPALDPCAALQRIVTLAPGETVAITFLLGQAAGEDAARDLIARMRAADHDALLADVRRHWSDILTAVQVRSPDRAMDILLNGWLLYQTLACRVWARAGFYQASGAYGFRDQLQDGMALTFSRPEMTREHLLRAAARQFPEGDVQHWWLPHSGQGVRTRISDDRVWLGHGVARYVGITGDTGILDEVLPFLDGPDLTPGAHDAFFQPGVSDQSATLFEHCARGLDQAIALTGTNGMPLIGTGDWNDGMNRVGEGGTGTSVWLGWLLIATIRMMAPLAETRDAARAATWRAHADAVRAAIERDGWDGAWYRRGTFDDGTPLGSAASEECRIDSIAQSWAVLSEAADPVRAATAMASMTRHLVRPDPGIALLFTPPFNATPLEPGYIKGYPPGLRENGGQYSHAAMWAVLAHARLGDGDAAGALFALLNPINHALTPEAAARYKVEPYVIAADVYSTAPHEGQGGWTWYTGSAGWMYRAGIEGLLGLTRRGSDLLLDPCFPRGWPRLEASVVHGAARFSIVIENTAAIGHGIQSARFNDAEVYSGMGPLVLPIIPGVHQVRVVLGRRAKAAKAG
jgi:cyclic beta-1,2-glucan synthetase